MEVEADMNMAKKQKRQAVPEEPQAALRFRLPARISLFPEQRKQALRWLNKLMLGDEECNHYVKGRIVDKYPNHPRGKELLRAHYSVPTTYEVMLEAELTADGRLQLVGATQGDVQLVVSTKGKSK